MVAVRSNVGGFVEGVEFSTFSWENSWRKSDIEEEEEDVVDVEEKGLG
jgi:hypothetical protein